MLTQDAKKKAQKFFTTLLVIAGLIVVGCLGYLLRPGVDDFTGRTKAAAAAFSGSSPTAPAEGRYSPVDNVSQSSVAPPASRKQENPPRQDTVFLTASHQSSSSPQFPKQVTVGLGWAVKESQRNVFKIPELKFIDREFTLMDAGLAKETCNQLIGGPTKEEWENACRSDISTTTKVLSIKIESETLYLKLSERPSKMGERQFKETLEKLEGVKKVEFF